MATMTRPLRFVKFPPPFHDAPPVDLIYATMPCIHHFHMLTLTSQPPGKRKIDDLTDEIADTPIKLEPDTSPPSTKRRRTHGATTPRAGPLKQLNNAPTRRLDIAVFGNGENGELGLGHRKHKKKSPESASRPRLNHLLDGDDVGVVQVAVGGKHCAALTHDGRVLTWGVNNSRALGRNTNWEPPKQLPNDTVDLNPLESTPAPVEGLEGLESSIAQVAATDNATFVLTKSGLVYGWGTFFVSWIPISLRYIDRNILTSLGE